MEDDKKYVKERKEVFRRARISELESRGFLPGLKERVLKEETYGEACEMLATAVLQKNLPEGFIAMRTSEYDDISNGMDTVILDKNTGNIVCAIDEIGQNKGARYEKKVDNTMKRNLKGGGLLKYGVSLDSRSSGGNKPEFKRGRAWNIPLFYCAFPESAAKAALWLKEQGLEVDWSWSFAQASANS